MALLRDRRSILAIALIFTLALLLLITLSLTSSLAGSLTVRHQLAPIYLLSNIRGKVIQPFAISGPEVDRLRDRRLSLACFRALNAQAELYNTKTKITLIQLEDQLLPLLHHQLPPKLSTLFASPDNIAISESFASRNNIRLTTSATLKLEGRHYRIVTVLNQQDLELLRLAGLSGDVYRSLGKQDWARANLFSYQALFLLPTDPSLSMARDEVSRLRPAPEQPQLAPILEFTLGQWTRSLTAIRICSTAILILIAVTLFSLQWIRIVTREHDFIVHEMLGASRATLFLSVIRAALLESGLGLSLAAILWALVQSLPLNAPGLLLLKMPAPSALWLFLAVALLITIDQALCSIISLSSLRIGSRTRTPHFRHNHHTRSLFVYASTLTATILLIIALSSKHYLDAEFKGRFLGDSSGLVKVDIYLPLDKSYSGPNPEKSYRLDMQQHYRRMVEQLRPFAAGGEVAAGYLRALDQIAGSEKVSFTSTAQAKPIEFPTRMITISPGFTSLLRLPIRNGADCSPAPVSGPPELLVNQALLRRAATTNALGATLEDLSTRTRYRIRGIIADTISSTASDPVITPIVFLCDYSNAWELYFRPAGDPMHIAQQAAQSLSRAYPQASIGYEVVSDQIDAALGDAQTQAFIAILFASIAIVAAIAAVSVISALAMREGRHGAAIMSALGATPIRVLRSLLAPILIASTAATLTASATWLYFTTGSTATYEWGLISRPNDILWLMVGFLLFTFLPIIIAARQSTLSNIASVLRDPN